jgi:hypothetical protein
MATFHKLIFVQLLDIFPPFYEMLIINFTATCVAVQKLRLLITSSHCGGPDSVPGLFVWDVGCLKLHWGRFLFECFGIPYYSVYIPYSYIADAI